MFVRNIDYEFLASARIKILEKKMKLEVSSFLLIILGKVYLCIPSWLVLAPTHCWASSSFALLLLFWVWHLLHCRHRGGSRCCRFARRKESSPRLLGRKYCICQCGSGELFRSSRRSLWRSERTKKCKFRRHCCEPRCRAARFGRCRCGADRCCWIYSRPSKRTARLSTIAGLLAASQASPL